ncbi:hypothetical protein S40285_09885 [Stachybotrys chlorohalonatus IBT 40285]|uniref:Uncharacterized protein n=1 Tax=Stachybotrys chlorohalonatus (strain IBT 40285) TaxID=1283841 RepID=A0A084QKL5_STAC4|nr:hypothetical protein S40285_09885 [Stachybotrys chlorohalonata IBT 40285]
MGSASSAPRHQRSRRHRRRHRPPRAHLGDDGTLLGWVLRHLIRDVVAAPFFKAQAQVCLAPAARVAQAQALVATSPAPPPLPSLSPLPRASLVPRQAEARDGEDVRDAAAAGASRRQPDRPARDAGAQRAALDRCHSDG